MLAGSVAPSSRSWLSILLPSKVSLTSHEWIQHGFSAQLTAFTILFCFVCVNLTPAEKLSCGLFFLSSSSKPCLSPHTAMPGLLSPDHDSALALGVMQAQSELPVILKDLSLAPINICMHTHAHTHTHTHTHTHAHMFAETVGAR